MEIRSCTGGFVCFKKLKPQGVKINPEPSIFASLITHCAAFPIQLKATRFMIFLSLFSFSTIGDVWNGLFGEQSCDFSVVMTLSSVYNRGYLFQCISDVFLFAAQGRANRGQ